VTIAAPVTQKNEVLKPEVAYVMTSFMKDVVNRGTGAPVRARGLKANVAGKTGTSRDGWFAGFTPSLVCVVWVGFDDGSQLGLTGANSALPIWSDFMSVALAEHPEWQGDWQPPEGIQQAEIDPLTGQLAKPDDPVKRTELFINGTLPGNEPPSETAEENPSPEEGQAGGSELFPSPEPTPSPSPKSSPKPERRPQDTSGLQGTITLDVDPTTGLIAVETCPVIRTKTYVLGTEPKKYCGPEYHTRPRTVATPPN
jgi:penicillin-binding protein 1B